MLKKLLSDILIICIMVCTISVSVFAEENSTTEILYDMLEKGTWVGSNATVHGTDSTRFPSRGKVIYTSVKKGVGVTLYDSFSEPINSGKVKISFDFYADENYVGYPEFYFSIANMNPIDLTKLWNSSPTFYPKEDGSVKYYGGSGSSGAVWTLTDTEATIQKGRWYTVESVVNFDEKGKIYGYLDGKKLYEVGGAETINGLIFTISGKETSNGKLYLDNIIVTEVKNDLSVSYAYGDGDCVVMEFTQPISAENAKDVKVTELLTGQVVDVLEVKQVSSNRISYRLPSGLPCAEYEFIFGENNISEYSASITGTIKVNGAVGISDTYREEIQTKVTVMEDSFNAYSPMEHAAASWSLDAEKWTKTGATWWGMGPLINENHQLQIHTFYGVKGSKSGVRGKLLESPQKDGKVSISYDLSFDEYDASEGNAVRLDFASGSNVFPILEVKGESVSVYPNQTEGESPVVLSQITKENNDSLLNYKIVLDFEAEEILLTIGNTVIPAITMSDALKTSGITDIVFMGCRNVENGSEEECNGALIDNFIASRYIKEYVYPPAVAGVRFLESDGSEKTLLETVSPLTKMIKVKFSKPVKQERLTGITVTNSKGNVSYTGYWNSETNTWEMSIQEKALKVKCEHILSVPADICDLNGLSLVDGYECKFDVGANSRTTNISYMNAFVSQNDKQGLAELLTDDPDSFGIVSSAFDAADKTCLAEMILSYAQVGSIQDSDDTVKALQKIVLMECANNRQTTELWDQDMSYGISDPRIVSVMEDRFDGIVTAQISGKSFVATDLNQFDEVLRNAVILANVNYADGSDQVENILTLFEQEISGGEGLNLTDNKIQAVYEKANFISVSELKSFVQTYNSTQVVAPGTTPSGSGNAGGGGFGGAGGGFVSQSTSSAGVVANNKGYENDTEKKEEVPIFGDIAEYPWAKEAIEILFAKGVIVGRGNNLFVPEANVLREETAKIIVEAFRFYIKGTIAFDDVKEEDWFYPYIVRAYNSGVVSGISETEFGSGQMITRQDLAVMVYNALAAAGMVEDAEETSELFIDNENISDYAVQAVYYLKKAGIISGDENGAFRPQSYASRAETAKIVYLATQHLK